MLGGGPDIAVEYEGKLAAVHAWRAPPYSKQSAPWSPVADGEHVGEPRSHDSEGGSSVQKSPHRLAATEGKAEGETGGSPRNPHDLGREPHEPILPPKPTPTAAREAEDHAPPVGPERAALGGNGALRDEDAVQVCYNDRGNADDA